MQQQYIRDYKNPLEDTDRSGYNQGKNNLPSQRSTRIPGTKSFHLYNTFLFIFSLLQVALYAIQAVTSPCSGLSQIFYGFMGVYVAATMVPIFTLIINFTKKGYTFIIIYTFLVILAKIGLVIASFAATSNHVGYCIVSDDVKVSMAIANAGEICSFCVQLLFIRHLRRVNQVKEVEMFMQSGRRKGYF